LVNFLGFSINVQTTPKKKNSGKGHHRKMVGKSLATGNWGTGNLGGFGEHPKERVGDRVVNEK